ncbi:MAG: zinc ribbon domain-containing protein [Collinsella sp.]|nr:zinc ribbon domain-containing protein [Collinsella sp.]
MAPIEGRDIMAMGDIITQIRNEAGITQQEMARKLYVTRQAISRWETGETTPGIDMVKLICVTFGVPLERFFEMPLSYYCQCCSMPIPDPALHGTEADGSLSQDFCRYCYDHGDFTAKNVSMDEFIEATAPMEAEALGVSTDEAVSLMATLLPHLKRWREEAEVTGR